MDLALVVQLVVSGLAIGMTYALVGLGLSLVFGVLGLVNFAHGEFYMLGAYLVYALTNGVGIEYLVSVVAGALVLALFGWILTATFIERLVRTNETAMFIGTLGLSYILLELVVLIWGPNPQQTVVPWKGSTVLLPGGSQISVHHLVTGGVAILATIALVSIIYRTPYGRYMRAVAENPAAAGLCGINVRLVYRGTFAIGSAVAALAGGTAGALTAVYPHVGQLIVLKAFVVVIVAGLGNVQGAIIAGIMLGLVETLGGGLITPSYQSAFGYLMLVVVLLVKPGGIMTRKPAWAA